jgi:G3E family GTPase
MLPVTIITGFLGSGKTTLLNFLLSHSRLKNSLVIINEFGEVAIDHLIISAPAENVRLLSNGCMCCQMAGELADTLSDVWRKRSAGELPPFDRILIETSGLADPVPVLRTLVTDENLSLLYTPDAVVAVVDAVHAVDQLARRDEARKQVALSDILLVSKTDLPSATPLAELEGVVRRINAGAEILPVMHGVIEPERLLDLISPLRRDRDVAQWLERIPPASSESAPPSHTHDIQTFSLCIEGPVSKTGLITWLSMLASFKGRHLLRMKGIVNVAGNPHLIHAVQTVVHEPVALDAWPGSDDRTRIVFIVQGVDRRAIESTVAVLGIADAFGNSRAIDPAAYARFCAAAQYFTHVPAESFCATPGGEMRERSGGVN